LTAMNMFAKRRMAALPLFAFLFIGNAHAEELNLRTLCPVGGSDGQAVLLIDTTDPLTPVAQERLKELLQGLGDSENKHHLQPGHELIVYYLPAQLADLRKPKLRVCNPGNPEDRTVADNLTSGVVEARRRWRAFQLRLRSALPRRDQQTESAQSPLLESLAVVAARHIPSLGVGQRKPTRLFLFSDMLQNSGRLSHYKSLPNMAQFKSMVGHSEMDSDLTGVEVHLFYVRRAGLEHLQTPKHYYWWTNAIESFGGRVMEQVPL